MSTIEARDGRRYAGMEQVPADARGGCALCGDRRAPGSDLCRAHDREVAAMTETMTEERAA